LLGQGCREDKHLDQLVGGRQRGLNSSRDRGVWKCCDYNVLLSLITGSGSVLGSAKVSVGDYMVGQENRGEGGWVRRAECCWPFPFTDFFFFGLFLGPYSWHMEVPRPGVSHLLQLPAHTTATWDPSHICNRHHNPQLCQILNPLSKPRDQTRVLMVPSWVC